MKIDFLSFDELPQLSNFDKAYQKEIEALSPFYKYPKTIESVKDVIKHKFFDEKKRNILCDALLEQYKKINTSSTVLKNIESLKSDNTFTVTTAHQPLLFCGPLYFMYKICSTINLSAQFKSKHPDYNFVPVYWMGEDHDFEEINHLFLFGKKITWDDFQDGNVSNYNCKNLNKTIEELFELLGNGTYAIELKKIISECFNSAFSYGEAAFRFIDKLFSKFGLIVLRPEKRELKKTMIPIFEEELFKNSSYYIINDTVKKLESAGFPNQAHARLINLFYLTPGKRSRIEKINDLFIVRNTEIKFNAKELKKELQLHPEKFSPNVILRPLFQETVLPNIAFVGGGGEIAYWLERKSQFEHYKVPYPLIIRRNSAMHLDLSTISKIEKLGLDVKDLFVETNLLIKKYLLELKNLDLEFNSEKKEIEEIYRSIAMKTAESDKTMESAVYAQLQQAINAIEKLEAKLLKINKQKQETEINQLKKIQEKLYLPNQLQERNENFMSLYLKYGKGLLDFLVSNMDPFNSQFYILTE
jgi:bacillithiol biosynthesis cysteine-adding enzyme BshC